MIDLTIIVPHFNTPHYLEILLKSIPKHDNIQVIVIDDKSDMLLQDFEILKADKSFAHVSFLNNATEIKNAGTCRNIGLKHAIGKWVLFADADDYFLDGFYETVKKFFCQDYDVVFFVPTSVDIDTNTKALRHKRYADIMLNYADKPNLQHELELRYFIAAPWSKMVRLDLIKENGIAFDEVVASNDLSYSVKIGHYMRKFCVSRNVIYIATQHKKSLTRTHDEAIYDARIEVFLWQYSFLRQNLSKESFRVISLMLSIYAIRKLVDALGYRLGLKKMLRTFMYFRRHKLKMFSIRFLSPRFMYNTFSFVKYVCFSYFSSSKLGE